VRLQRINLTNLKTKIINKLKNQIITTLELNIMNSLNQILENLANELDALLLNQNYLEYGNLQRASKTLFQYGFDKGILFMDKSITDKEYVETFFITGSKLVYPLTLIGLDYQENEFTCRGESISFNHITMDNY
jgi:hypothetical protein